MVVESCIFNHEGSHQNLNVFAIFAPDLGALWNHTVDPNQKWIQTKKNWIEGGSEKTYDCVSSLVSCFMFFLENDGSQIPTTHSRAFWFTPKITIKKKELRKFHCPRAVPFFLVCSLFFTGAWWKMKSRTCGRALSIRWVSFSKSWSLTDFTPSAARCTKVLEQSGGKTWSSKPWSAKIGTWKLFGRLPVKGGLHHFCFGRGSRILFKREGPCFLNIVVDFQSLRVIFVYIHLWNPLNSKKIINICMYVYIYIYMIEQ